MQTSTFSAAMPGLPDPELDGQFYDGVPTRRFVAWIVDVLVVMALGVPVGVLFGLLTLGFGFAAFPLVLAGMGLLYRTATIANSSATWGMRFMGIELRKSDGARLDPLTAFLHALIYVVSMAVFPVQLLSCAMILTTRYRQGLGDIFLRTTAINRPEL
ncbi:MAG: RDD family protein [Rhodobacteraceae bacterium]|uniref:RDD family protein n=1 Tax=Amaricoccus sp. B4 TaxID=3368557 RepID=UPI000DABBE8E|nr:RDD family protein [Paracoccaceae bacterium]